MMLNDDLAPYASYLLSEPLKKRAGRYLQNEFRLAERIILNTGLRHDDQGGGYQAQSLPQARAHPDL